ncbi:hypothetical protein QCA50_002340 [Cerrena zonata]|uniref:Carboxypeptidase n=1 Tax=Cerrena zonata TaxID=2478898 RepID=A0AAW0GV63_9APHY
MKFNILIMTVFKLVLAAALVTASPATYDANIGSYFRHTPPEQAVLASPSLESGVGSEAFVHPSFTNYALRLTTPDICDTSVNQWSGFLDISQTRHLFFWFFEARRGPKNAPLMLWLNGGPGCSSIGSGLLFENGPCSIAYGGNSTIVNQHSWNEVANIIYLEQPIGTGFSYSDDGSEVTTLADVAVDVYAFLQVFLKRFPQYSSTDFHIAAESWGGHYGPAISSCIWHQNKALATSPMSDLVKINLASLILANGLTEPKSQFESIPDYACDGGAPYPFLERNGFSCRTLKAVRPGCLRMIQACYDTKSKPVCTPATFNCWFSMMGSLGSNGANPYDIRRKCEPGTALCYEELEWVDHYMNNATIKKSLGVEPDQKFQTCNMDVNQKFYIQGQAMLNSAVLLPEMINEGLRLLVYAGNTDSVCNYMGVERWMIRLVHDLHNEFVKAPSLVWRTKASNYSAGRFRRAGPDGGAGNVTFVEIFDAGHMAPHDQPEATLDMVTRWVQNTPWLDSN